MYYLPQYAISLPQYVISVYYSGDSLLHIGDRYCIMDKFHHTYWGNYYTMKHPLYLAKYVIVKYLLLGVRGTITSRVLFDIFGQVAFNNFLKLISVAFKLAIR